jgi:asparagine synthase (glutamine-hydrolysing)
LSGEGSDELFGGYFFFLENSKKGVVNEFPWAPYFQEVSSLLDPDIEKITGFKNKVQTKLSDMMNRYKSNDTLNKVLYLFLKIYLQEMLERQDKTSMAWGVESRVPFMDYRLVEFAINIPSEYKIQDGVEKYILKDISRGILPSEIVDRKKKPFPFPIDPKSIFTQKNIAKDLVQSSSSRIFQYFDKKQAADFFNRKNRFEKMDSLAIFRTSYAMIALELWHKTFGV